MDYKNIAPWELLQKKMTWEHLNYIHNKRILDFGSGSGMTANHFAIDNEVIAIEPDEKVLQDRFKENNYTQIKGDMNRLKNFQDESFDMILCHNVFEYVDEREEILEEFSRILKKDGFLSIVKHNKAGRVMQMVVLLNNFEHANELLAGKNGHAQQFGTINYYKDKEILEWSNKFEIEKILGMRTFWDLQQNQEIQKDETWQENMLEIELKVSELEEYKAIAFFHHIILRKR
ncbi:class I SAM-dependent methyltransferase [Clostridium cellulovorans]|uniref:Methyltransferase type 11 n=1 Tax=Clostridium cellulovorans (strain ATCC 35296 / DSM 3052 / OCM 3 / 743B) TaxID=573061 RepID=D9SPK1_CLOC7|nr:class I SAM-dependent methyltransferase [Clostridium cellulovorans]ADL50050.1 Methyltransferase type 11 [Clostridium cellulovorans 743B]